MQQDLVLQQGVQHQVHAQLWAQVTQQCDEGRSTEIHTTGCTEPGSRTALGQAHSNVMKDAPLKYTQQGVQNLVQEQLWAKHTAM